MSLASEKEEDEVEEVEVDPAAFDNTNSDSLIYGAYNTDQSREMHNQHGPPSPEDDYSSNEDSSSSDSNLNEDEYDGEEEDEDKRMRRKMKTTMTTIMNSA